MNSLPPVFVSQLHIKTAMRPLWQLARLCAMPPEWSLVVGGVTLDERRVVVRQELLRAQGAKVLTGNACRVDNAGNERFLWDGRRTGTGGRARAADSNNSSQRWRQAGPFVGSLNLALEGGSARCFVAAAFRFFASGNGSAALLDLADRLAVMITKLGVGAPNSLRVE